MLVFENVAYDDETTCSQLKVTTACLSLCVNKSGPASLTLSMYNDAVLSLLLISKLDTQLLGRCVLPCKEFYVEYM